VPFRRGGCLKLSAYELGCMPIVKKQSNLITFFCEILILVPYKKDML
jgi:hypothetical protein